MQGISEKNHEKKIDTEKLLIKHGEELLTGDIAISSSRDIAENTAIYNIIGHVVSTERMGNFVDEVLTKRYCFVADSRCKLVQDRL